MMRRLSPSEKAKRTRLLDALRAAKTVEAKRNIIDAIMAVLPAKVKPRTTTTKRNPLSFAELIGHDGSDADAVAAFVTGTIDPRSAERAAVRRVKTAKRSANARQSIKRRPRNAMSKDAFDALTIRIERMRAAFIEDMAYDAEENGNVAIPSKIERRFASYAEKNLRVPQYVVRKILKKLR